MRMRTIKPEFWRDEKIKQQTREHRLLLAGLYSYVDDNGVGLDDYRQIAADLFALEDDPVEVREFVREGLARLSRGFLITRYTVCGVAYLYINEWPELQKIDKPNKPRYPLPSNEAASVSCDNKDIRETLARDSRDPREGPSPGTGEQGNRGTGEEKTRSSEMSKSEPDRFDEFWSAYPKRVGKQAAIKAWRNAIKLASPDTIIAGAQRYAESRRGEDPKFTAHPSTWLNAGRWDDEQQPAHSPQPEISTADRRIAQLQAMKQQNRPRDPPGDTTLRSVSGGRLA